MMWEHALDPPGRTKARWQFRLGYGYLLVAGLVLALALGVQVWAYWFWVPAPNFAAVWRWIPRGFLVLQVLILAFWMYRVHSFTPRCLPAGDCSRPAARQ